MAEFKRNAVNRPQEKAMTEREVRELIAAALSNWTGITRFRTLETSIVTISDYTNSQHTHASAANGGQITDAALSAAVTVPKGGTGVATIPNNAVVIGQGAGAVSSIAGLAGTKIYYVSDTSGGAVTRKLTFTNGVLTAEV